jgi:D-alanine-D-alanine ligase-like ATP-grasp enzyme
MLVISFSIFISNVAIPDLMHEIVDWDEIIKKEARGMDEYDLGEIQDLNEEFVVTKKGIIDKGEFYLPKSKFVKFDGAKVWFSVTKETAKIYKDNCR